MTRFQGFPSSKTRLIGLPAEVFSELLPMIDDLAELKLTLFVLWALQQKDRDAYRYLRLDDFTQAAIMPMHGLSGAALTDALSQCVTRGTLLHAEVDGEALYFANSAAGREAVAKIETGAWSPGDRENPVQILPERPSVFKLYEDNFGALTPMVIDRLKDTVTEFGLEWVEDAIRISVEQNKRSLSYVRAILDRWKKEGRHETSQRHSESGDQRGIAGKYADLFER